MSHEHVIVLDCFGPLHLTVTVLAEETRDGWETWSEAEDERGRSVSLSLMEQAEAEIAALDRLQVEQGPASCPGWLP